MTDLHKNECPTGIGQIVKSISKTATSIIAAVDRFLPPQVWGVLAGFDIAAIAVLVLNGGIA